MSIFTMILLFLCPFLLLNIIGFLCIVYFTLYKILKTVNIEKKGIKLKRNRKRYVCMKRRKNVYKVGRKNKKYYFCFFNFCHKLLKSTSEIQFQGQAYRVSRTHSIRVRDVKRSRSE